MKSILFLFILTVTLYSQNNGIYIDGVPLNQSSHFLFSLNSDTIVNGTWTRIAKYPQKLFGVNCYYWPATGKVFTCGGATESGVSQKNCYFYNPVSNSYETADSLPDDGRWSGKLVRVKDSLYLIGSASNFVSPDGLIYKYSPAQNNWVLKDTMPSPRVHESAVCVFKDSLIICIGGSTSSFAGTTNIIRAYNPRKNTWKTLSPFPLTTTTGHAECNSSDSTIVVVGGYGTTFNNVIYRGKINHYNYANDSVGITWQAVATTDTTIFHTGIYRVGGGMAGSWMLFGPALRNTSTYNTIYAVKFGKLNDSLNMFWYRMVPNIPDSAGNRPTIGVNQLGDSAYIYLFSGSRGLTVLDSAYRFSFALPIPVGLQQISSFAAVGFILYQNYPNPFNPVTKIRFAVPVDTRIALNDKIVLKVYDILGREIAELVNQQLKPGEYESAWDAGNFSSGIYFYKLILNSTVVTAKKMVLLK